MMFAVVEKAVNYDCSIVVVVIFCVSFTLTCSYHSMVVQDVSVICCAQNL